MQRSSNSMKFALLIMLSLMGSSPLSAADYTHNLSPVGPQFEVFLASAAGTDNHQPAPAIVICPGGGYSKLVLEKEGLQIAQALNSKGFSAFLLRYRLPEQLPALPLLDLLSTVAQLRSHAADYGIEIMPDSMLQLELAIEGVEGTHALALNTLEALQADQVGLDALG